MKLLGAVLAGGASSRFGSDKALAVLDGRSLLDHVVATLAPQVDAVVVVGRHTPGIACVPDRPHAGLGPLGGLAGALVAARTGGFDIVATVPCDAVTLPPALVADLARAGPPAFLATLPVVGLWPATLLEALDAHLAAGGSRSVRRFAALVGARALDGQSAIPNVNTPADLDALRRRR